jgi:type IV secretion system protein VirB10
MAFLNGPAPSPGFNPRAPEREIRAGRAGSRFKLVIGAVLVLVGLAVLGQKWVMSLFRSEQAEAAPRVMEVTQTPPPVADRKPDPPSSAPPPRQPEQRATAQPGLAARPQVEQPEVAITWNIQAPEPPKGLTFDGTTRNEALGCSLRPGANEIRATLVSTVQSEIAGPVTATVMEDILDADGYGTVLVPQGTKLVGAYKPEGRLRFHDRRVPFVWRMLTFPPGWPERQAILPDATGLDAAGSVGVGGEVRTRWGDVVATAALFTVFDGIQRAATPQSHDLAGAISRSASVTVGRLGRDLTERFLDLEPEITIPAGTPIVVHVDRPVQVSSACG